MRTLIRTLMLFALLGLTAAGCATGPFYGREAWDVAVEATPRSDRLVHIRTYTLAPSDCYTAGEIRSAPSTRAESIQVEAVVADAGSSCAREMTEVVHDLPGLRLEPDDRFLEVVVSADGIERNRVFVDLATAPPVGGGYGGYPPAYPSYDERRGDPYADPRSR
jgi:hypothetical protein